MPSTAKEEKKKEEHKHYWMPGHDETYEKCSCGELKVSPQEYQYRIDAWNSYFGLVKNTPAYRDYQEMKRVWPNKELMKPILERINKRGHWGENDFGDRVWIVDQVQLTDKPSFPDPSTWNKYVIGGSL